MVENNRNRSSAILVISLIIFFFYFFHREKEKNVQECPVSSSVIFEVTNSCFQAIITPATTPPEIHHCRINTVDGKDTFLGCASNRELLVHNQVSSHYLLSQLKLLSKDQIIGITFLQKVPEQEKEEDLSPVI